MKFDITKITRAAGMAALRTRKNSPHLLFVAGVLGTTASTVLACRATLKLEKTLDDLEPAKNNVLAIKDGINKQTGTVSRQDYVQELVGYYTHTSLTMTKLYGPAALAGLAGIACLTGSHVQLTRRNTALMAAYTALDTAYKNYRERVRQAVGEEKELDLYRSMRTETIKNELDKKETVRSVDPNKWSAYARFFDEASTKWEKNPELNRLHVQAAQNFANEKLRAKGYLFLNEVYDMLGLEKTRAGQVVGWIMGGDGDNYVDFGMFEAHNSRARDFINGQERSILLDFNVDGVILDKIP
jgi:hypothetical protein